MQSQDGESMAAREQPALSVETTSPGLKPCAAHPGVETRLSCSHCDTPICPKCMVVCEVGMKCKKCTQRSASHVVKAEARDYIMAGVLSLALGFGFGYSLEYTFMYSWYMFILSFLLGRWLGPVVHRFARYKLADSLKYLMVLAVAAGILLSPAHESLLLMAQSGGAYASLGFHNLIASLAFVLGVGATFHNFRR